MKETGMKLLKNYDCLIVGAGVSGLYTALNLRDDLSVLMISKKELGLSNSSLAQGGIATVFDQKNDKFENHIEDTLKAGGFQNNINSVEMIVKSGPENIEKLIELGVEFDKRKNGNIHLTLEGGHSNPRILHHKDSTGNEIVNKLYLAVKEKKNIEIKENCYLSQMEKKDGGFYAELFSEEEKETVFAKRIVMVTGGIGRVFEYTTNSAISTGDGIVLAYKLGAKVSDMSLIQFHPTAFAAKSGRERFLISEALRGEGAYLINSENRRFMDRYDERLELAPRDIVSKSIILESRRLKNDNFYLVISHKDENYIRERFPMIYERCLEEGVDITTDKIPVFPCQHYLMGGIDVDLEGRTSVKGLYAAGECSHTGVHGKNRLASNSLLEAVVYAKKIAGNINAEIDEDIITTELSSPFKEDIGENPVMTGMRTKIRSIVQSAYFVIPDFTAAREGFVQIKEIIKSLESGNYIKNKDYYEVYNLAVTAYLIFREIV